MAGTLDIMNAIREGLDDLKVTDGWTEAVLTKLCTIGRGFGFQVGAKKDMVDEAHRDRGEWLYDTIWLKCDRDGRVIEVPLVAECEWKSPKAIKYDFDKLLLARAGIRLMIYDGHFKPGPKGLAEQLATRIREFNSSRAEDVWLLAAWHRTDSNGLKEKGWRFKYFTVGKYSTTGMNGPECVT